jgi:signal transduction histidine kinase
MKIIEFYPDGKSTIISSDASFADESNRNKVLVEVLPVIFHKLKNKLTPILGYTQILLSRASDEFTRDRLGRIEKNGIELTEALNTLKEYFRSEPTSRQPGNMNRMIEGLAAQWQNFSRAAGARIVLELDPGIPDLPLAPGQLNILLLSMVDNAVNALKTKPGSGREIRLATRAEGSSLKLVISDNGSGINEDELASIWLPFYSTFPDHAGLGLVICEKIIANHDATCAVFSSRGEFSRFEINFPCPENSVNQQIKSADDASRSQN